MIEFSLIIVFVYISSLTYLYFNQRNMMYFPDTTRPVPVKGVETINVKTEDGLDLQAWFLPPADKNKPVILLFHGNAGNFSHRLWKAALFHEKGYGVLLAEYRGYGGNPGKISEQGFYNDGRAYTDYLIQRGYKIVLYGESIGTGVATRMAAEYEILGLILEAPYTSIGAVAQSVYPVVPVKLLLRDRFPSIDIIGKVKAPKLFIHGALDRTIPVRFGQKLFETAPEPKTFILLESAGHNDLYDHSAAEHVIRFLDALGR